MPVITSSSVSQEQQGSGGTFKLALLTLAILYFMLGFITVMNDTLVPFFKQGFNLTYSQSSLVQFYFYLTYGLISIPAGKIVDNIGFKKGMVSGFFIASIGAFLFYPASLFHEYYLFLAALFIVAIGIVLLQVSANPYITVLGPAKTAASRFTLIQGVGSLGTTLAPIFGAHFILSKIGENTDTSSALVKPYFCIALSLLVIGIIIFFLKLPIVQAERIEESGNEDKQGVFSLLQKYVQLRFGVLALFMYVGAEVAIGTYLTNYIADKLNIEEGAANVYLSFYWGGMLVGRFVGSIFLKRFNSAHILSFVAILAAILVVLSITTNNYLSIWAMILVGLCNSIMFATIFSLAVQGLGQHTGKGSGLLSTAIVGGAFLTYFQGVLKDQFNWSVAFLLPVVAFAVIFYYGIFAAKRQSSIEK